MSEEEVKALKERCRKAEDEVQRLNFHAMKISSTMATVEAELYSQSVQLEQKQAEWKSKEDTYRTQVEELKRRDEANDQKIRDLQAKITEFERQMVKVEEERQLWQQGVDPAEMAKIESDPNYRNELRRIEDQYGKLIAALEASLETANKQVEHLQYENEQYRVMMEQHQQQYYAASNGGVEYGADGQVIPQAQDPTATAAPAQPSAEVAAADANSSSNGGAATAQAGDGKTPAAAASSGQVSGGAPPPAEERGVCKCTIM